MCGRTYAPLQPGEVYSRGYEPQPAVLPWVTKLDQEEYLIAMGRVAVVAGQGIRELEEAKSTHPPSTTTPVSTGQTSNRYQVMQVSNLFRGGQPDAMGALDTWAEVHERDELVLMSATSADLQDLPAKAVRERCRLLQQRKQRKTMDGTDAGGKNEAEATGVRDDDANTGVNVLGCIFACNLGAVQQLRRKPGSVRRMVEALGTAIDGAAFLGMQSCGT